MENLVTGYFPTNTPGVNEEQRTSGLGFVVARDSDGTIISQPTSWQDADGMLHIFGVSGAESGEAGSLRVLHQSGWQATEHGTTSNYPVFPVWTSAQVAGAPTGIGGYDLARPYDRLVAFDYAGTGHSDHLLAYRPGPSHYYSDQSVWVIERAPEWGGFTYKFTSATGLPGFDFTSSADMVVAYDYKGSGSANHLLAYRPGAGKFAIFTKQKDADTFNAVNSADSGGIGKYPLDNAADRLMPFDYTGSGKDDHLLAYRPGTGRAWVLAPQTDGSFKAVVQSSNGLGGFPLNNTADIVTGFDYNGSGSNTHLLAYRPGDGTVNGTVYILVPDGQGGFTAVVHNDASGIGDYDLKVPEDRLVPFDYTGLGMNDHILAYRPGINSWHADQTVWILERDSPDTSTYHPVVQSLHGLGGYDFASPPPLVDMVTAYDFTSGGSLAYLVAYRPGAGKVSVMGQRGGTVAPVYQVPPGPATVVTVGLHADVSAFQLDPYPDYKPSELIKMSGMTAAEAYCICTQDVTTSGWQTDKVRLPQPEEAAPPFIVSHYVADVTLLSKLGAPMPGHNVTVSADSLVEVQIGAISYQVGPGRAITVTTNDVGKLVVSIAARGLNPPTVHVNADGLESGTAIDFASQVNDFLAGTGTLPSQAGTFTPGLLEHAQTTPNKPGLGASGLADWPALKERGLTPQTVVDHCTNMYAQAAGSKQLQPAMIEGSDQPQPIVGYVIQLWDPGRPAYQAFRSHEELAAYKTYRDNHPAYGGWWDDFTNWASDVWEGIKTGAAKVAEVIVSTVTEIAVWVGNAVVSLGEMIINAIEQAVQAVEAVFQMIADAITRVIDWLKSLFAFKDIWDTKTALQDGTNKIVTLGIANLNHVGELADDWFEQKRQEVIDQFTTLKAQFATTAIGDFGNITPLPATATGSVPTAQELGSNPQATWMSNQLQTAGSNGLVRADALTAFPDSPLVTAFTDFVQDLNASTLVDDVITALGDVATAAAGLFGPANPAAAQTTPVLQLLDAVEKLALAALSALDHLVNDVLVQAVKIGNNINDLLSYAPDLGPLNTLYEWIQELGGNSNPEALTLGGLFHLVAAFFVTTIYKLFNGVDQAPFPSKAFPALPRPPWMTDDEAVADPDPNVMHTLQLVGGLMGIISIFPSLYGDLSIMWEGKVANPVSRLTSGIALFCSIFSGVVLSAPPVTGRAWAGPASGAFTAQLLQFLLGAAAFAANLAGEIKTPWLQNILGGVGGPILTSAFGIANLACLARDDDVSHASPYTWGGDMVGVISTVDSVIRIKASETDESFPWRVGVTAGVNFFANLTASIMTIVSGITTTAPRISFANLHPIATGTANKPFTLDVRARTTGGDEPCNKPLQNFTMTGGDAANLTINPDTGLVTGTPAKAGDVTVTFTVSDSNGPPFISAPVTGTISITT